MDIQCPSCKAGLSVVEGKENFVCPACGAPLEVMTNEFGLTIIGVMKHPPANPGAMNPRIPSDTRETGDPVIEEYDKWRMRAVFVMLCGLVFAAILFLDIKNAYINYGYYFWKNPDNLKAVPFLLLFTLVPLGAGTWLYLFLGKRLKEYKIAHQEKI